MSERTDIMLNGIGGLQDVEYITQAHMEDTRKHLQAIRAGASDNNKFEGLVNRVKALINFAKEARPQLPAAQPLTVYETQSMPGV